MKAKIGIATLVLCLWCTAEASSFKILNCWYQKDNGKVKAHLLMDNQFIKDVHQQLSEGIEYHLHLLFKLNNGKWSKTLKISYDPISRNYIIKNHHETRFKKVHFFNKSLRTITVTLPETPLKVKAKRTDPYLSFPFNLIPFIGTYSTPWIKCHEGE